MAGVFTVFGLAVLIQLGFWQLERLEWKEDLLARMEANLAATPEAIERYHAFPEFNYRRVCAAGVFLHDKEIHVLGASVDGQGGVLIYTPLGTSGGPVLVNRGWVPNSRKEPNSRPEGQIEGVVEICGVVRHDRTKGYFSPENNPDENRWFTPMVGPMAAAAGLENPYEFFIDADKTPNPGGFPVGGQTFIDIPNNHLGYAITWFGLAAVLLVIYLIFARRQRRKT